MGKVMYGNGLLLMLRKEWSKNRHKKFKFSSNYWQIAQKTGRMKHIALNRATSRLQIQLENTPLISNSLSCKKL